ncbi:amidohydrolase family protein [Nitrospira sp. Nam80]
MAATCVFAVFALTNSPVPAPASGPSAPQNYAFTNGRWFDGSGFQEATWYSVQGRLTRTPPIGPVEVVDLAGAFVVPPFGEAHNHNIEGEWNLKAVVARYVRDGVFYVKNPNDVHFRTDVQAGVDEIAHLPGWLVVRESDMESARLSEGDARLAASKGVVVVTTTVAGRMMPGTGVHHPGGHAHEAQESTAHPDSHGDGGTLQNRARDVQRDNLRLLHRYGVKLAIGSDHADTSLAEALSLKALGVFDNLTLLKLWCEITPAAIFPGRRIGRLDEGYEASFLALEGDPLANFANVQTIELRVKQGMRLDGPFH